MLKTSLFSSSTNPLKLYSFSRARRDMSRFAGPGVSISAQFSLQQASTCLNIPCAHYYLISFNIICSFILKQRNDICIANTVRNTQSTGVVFVADCSVQSM